MTTTVIGVFEPDSVRQVTQDLMKAGFGDRDIDAASLAGTWQRDPTIAPLTGNPLLLSTLLMVHHLDGSLPGHAASTLYRVLHSLYRRMGVSSRAEAIHQMRNTDASR